MLIGAAEFRPNKTKLTGSRPPTHATKKPRTREFD